MEASFYVSFYVRVQIMRHINFPINWFYLPNWVEREKQLQLMFYIEQKVGLLMRISKPGHYFFDISLLLKHVMPLVTFCYFSDFLLLLLFSGKYLREMALWAWEYGTQTPVESLDNLGLGGSSDGSPSIASVVR